MATPSDYTHFENAVPCGATGLAVGAKGSEVTVADSSGNLYQAGTQITLSATLANKAISHATTSSIKVAYGQATVDDSKAVNTGLTTISRAFTSIASATGPTAANGQAVIVQSTYSGATLTMKGFKHGAAATSDMTAVADGTTVAVDWLVLGV